MFPPRKIITRGRSRGTIQGPCWANQRCDAGALVVLPNRSDSKQDDLRSSFHPLAFIPSPPPVTGDSPTTTPMMLLVDERIDRTSGSGGGRRRRCGARRSGRRRMGSSTAPALTGRLFDVPLLQPVFVAVGKVERCFVDPEAKDARVVRLRRFGRNHVLLKEEVRVSITQRNRSIERCTTERPTVLVYVRGAS